MIKFKKCVLPSYYTNVFNGLGLSSNKFTLKFLVFDDFTKVVMHIAEQLSVCTNVQKEKLQNMEYNRNKNTLLWRGMQSYSQFALSLYIKY